MKDIDKPWLLYQLRSMCMYDMVSLTDVSCMVHTHWYGRITLHCIKYR